MDSLGIGLVTSCNSDRSPEQNSGSIPGLQKACKMLGFWDIVDAYGVEVVNMHVLSSTPLNCVVYL